MLGSIRRLFGLSRSRAHHIFTFHDGSRWRRVDPVAAWRDLESVLGTENVGGLLKMLALTPPPAPPGVDVTNVVAALQRDQATAAKKLADAACAAFGVEPLSDDSGLTEPQRIRLVADFVVFLLGLMEEVRPFVTWPVAASVSPPPASPTGSSSDSGTPAVVSPAIMPGT